MSAICPASVISRCSGAVVRAAAYIRTRQSPCGGFCFYRYRSVDEPSLGDTYCAVAALRLFGIEVPNARKTADFVSQAQVFGLTYLYFGAFTLDHLSLGSRIGEESLELIQRLPITLPEASQSIDASGWLESARKTIRLQKRFAPNTLEGAAEGETLSRRLAPAAFTARSENRHAQVAAFMADLMKRGGLGVHVNLWDSCLALSVSALLRLRPSQEIAAFVDSLQHPSVGFMMTPNSAMTSLDVVYAGARCCEILGLAVRHRQEAIDFTLACQTTSGGFAHAPDALPNLEFTYQALKTLAILVPESMHPH